MSVVVSNQRGQRWIAEWVKRLDGWMDRKMEVGMGGGCNPRHTTLTMTLFPYPLHSQEKVGFVPENTDTHNERWQCDCSCRAYICWNCGPVDTCR